MFRTIKAQILLVTISLVALLLSQVFLARNSQSNFVNSLDLTQQAVIKVSLVRELERDVIDLQRNVLIYKDSASESAVARFNLLMEDTQTNLTRLEELTSTEANRDVYRDYISRMRSHLNDYTENFASVVIGRTKRQSLHQSGMLEELETLFDDISAITAQPQAELDSLESVQYAIARAENYLLQYLREPEQTLIQPFNQQMLSAKTQIKNRIITNQAYQPALDKLNQVEKDFLQLTKITRGYLFLVNVVMAGSANEFLFLARELNRLVTDKLASTNLDVKQSLVNTRIGSNIFSLIGMLLAAATALFLAYRIMLPINIITHIFQKLAKGEDVQRIPNLLRKDEIGQLSKAADVFRDKNKQTTRLLEQSQLLNAKQETLNKELVASNQKVEQANASKSMFLANMSHEIRTPMNGIIGMLEVVLRSELTPSQRDQLSKAAYSGQILMSLINDILDFSKIEAGKLDIERIEFSVESLFANILANVSNRAREKNLNIRFNANPTLPAHLLGDPLRIGQILLNLCSNAIKFTRNGQVTVDIDYTANLDSPAVTLQLTVSDTGIGMAPELVNKVFDSFTQADGSTSRNFGGTGLGLTIVTQLAELMGGKVTVKSEVNKGSVFSVSLLLERTDAPQQLVTPLPHFAGKLYYFSSASEGFLSTHFIETTGIHYHHFPLALLSANIEQISASDVVILDLEDQQQFRDLFDSIDLIVAKALKVGFVTNTQPSNLPKQLQAMWPAECVTHPFTPSQARFFLQDLLSTQAHTSEPSADFFTNEHQAKHYEGHVLLVEDNSINQAVAGEMLKLLGLTFDIAEDGHQAVTKIVNSPQYDLVLMDIQMPIMDGYQATKTLREQGFNTLIICGLSANAMKQDYEKAKQVGMDDYIVKPLKHQTLETLVAKYLPEKPLVN